MLLMTLIFIIATILLIILGLFIGCIGIIKYNDLLGILGAILIVLGLIVMCFGIYFNIVHS